MTDINLPVTDLLGTVPINKFGKYISRIANVKQDLRDIIFTNYFFERPGFNPETLAMLESLIEEGLGPAREITAVGVENFSDERIAAATYHNGTAILAASKNINEWASRVSEAYGLTGENAVKFVKRFIWYHELHHVYDRRKGVSKTQKEIDVGEFLVIEDTEKILRFNFIEENKMLKGDWILRKLSTGDYLFWKPFPIVAVMPTKNVEVALEQGEVIEPVDQQFSIFQLETDSDNSFRGILLAEGVWTGGDLHTTLFTDQIIVKIAQKMQANINNQLVDYNHSFVNEGSLIKVELREERGINYIWVEGVGQKPIPPGSGLSIILKSTLKWNSKLNVFVLLEAEPIGSSIMTNNKPACTICMIR